MPGRLPLLDDPDLYTFDAEQRRVLAQARPLARRFTFAEEDSRRLGRLIANCGALIVQHRQFARAPYPTTYIEIALKAMVAEIATPEQMAAPLENSDETVGMLVHGNQLIVLAERDGGAAASPISYGLGQPADLAIDAQHIVGLTFGATLHALDDETINQAAIENRVIYAMPDAAAMATNCYGDLRNLWACLLVINRPSALVTFERRPAGGLIIKGKRRAYAAQTMVRIDASAEREPKMMLARIARETPRGHEVRGHYVRFHLARGCVHAWPGQASLQDNGTLRWDCQRCGGFRIWKPMFQRGDASKGWVEKRYAVGVDDAPGDYRD